MSKAQTDEEVTRRVAVWRNMDKQEFEAQGASDLHEFLGWTREEYIRWTVCGCLPKE